MLKKSHMFVGLSGGVDSSVSAALLLREGHRVTGVFIKGWQPEFFPCTWEKDRVDAMRVAAHLGISFETFDAEEIYRREVGEYLISEYRAGRTPNPDVMCNRVIKFGAFLSYAKERGADAIATGHYARIQKEPGGAYALLRGVDPEKDQSYFLWTLSQDELSQSVFPVGSMRKSDVRALAHEFDLPTAEKKDSQGLCFVGKLDMKEFLSLYLTVAPGPVETPEGEIVGEHDGVSLYTIGQRHGFRSRSSVPQYVVGKNPTRNALIVSPDPIATDFASRDVSISDTRWVRAASQGGEAFEGQVRYRQRPKRCSVFVRGKDATVRFEEPILVAPGQSLVLYRGDECLGGGVIREK